MNSDLLYLPARRKEESYKVKEDILLKNLLCESRQAKAKVLRLQQLKNYEKNIHNETSGTILRNRKASVANRHVSFSSTCLVQEAIRDGNKFEVLEFITSGGIPVNFNNLQGEGMSLLHQSCIYDDYIIAQALIKQGASINSKDDFGGTPLHICCMWESVKCAQLLISNNASANILDVDGNFPVDLTPENSHLNSMMKKHMQQKLKIDESNIHSLRNKSQKSILQSIRKLLEEGQSVDVTNSEGISFLHIAVTNGYLVVARMLLENSANVNIADSNLWTPLHCASKYGQVKMVKLLLSHYANPHAKTDTNYTPKEFAKCKEIIKMLGDAEDSFLDLPKQKTPAKPKRFSASLLDQCDADEDIIRVTTRFITSMRLCKRDIRKEMEIIDTVESSLRHELKADMEFVPLPNSNSGEILHSTSPSMWNFLPPPVPPRDDNTDSIKFSGVATKFDRKAQQGTNKDLVHDEVMVKAVITIQRAYRSYLSNRGHNTPIILEESENVFFEQMVIQNANEIIRESDRVRALKSSQRNSWCVQENAVTKDVRNITSQSRPLSTGTLPMPNMTDPNSIWVSQSKKGIYPDPYHHYDLPPDVIPRYPDRPETWSTMPRSRMPKTKRADSLDSGVSMDSTKKDYIELAGTVKRSLTLKNKDFENDRGKQLSGVRLRKNSYLNSSSPTYCMPPLTPTVATLIHTAVSKPRPHETSKVMKPVMSSRTLSGGQYAASNHHHFNQYTNSPTINQNQHMYTVPNFQHHLYTNVDGPTSNQFEQPTDRYKNPNSVYYSMPRTYSDQHNLYMNQATQPNHQINRTNSPVHSPREHKYGTLMSNRAAILRDAKRERGHDSQARHSWNGDRGNPQAQPGPSPLKAVHPIISPPAESEDKLFSDGLPPAYPDNYSLSSSHQYSLPRTPSGRRGSRGSENPPRPPRRSPSTKLSSASPGTSPGADKNGRKQSVSDVAVSSPPKNVPVLLPITQNEQFPAPPLDLSPDDELPIIPPALPLMTPQALVNREMGLDPSLPLPPPPDELLKDTLRNMGTLRKKDERDYFPPPPPSF